MASDTSARKGRLIKSWGLTVPGSNNSKRSLIKFIQEGLNGIGGETPEDRIEFVKKYQEKWNDCRVFQKAKGNGTILWLRVLKGYEIDEKDEKDNVSDDDLFKALVQWDSGKRLEHPLNKLFILE